MAPSTLPAIQTLFWGQGGLAMVGSVGLQVVHARRSSGGRLISSSAGVLSNWHRRRVIPGVRRGEGRDHPRTTPSRTGTWAGSMERFGRHRARERPTRDRLGRRRALHVLFVAGALGVGREVRRRHPDVHPPAAGAGHRAAPSWPVRSPGKICRGLTGADKLPTEKERIRTPVRGSWPRRPSPRGRGWAKSGYLWRWRRGCLPGRPEGVA